MQHDYISGNKMGSEDTIANFTTKVFIWMGAGLAITAVIAYFSVAYNLVNRLNNIWYYVGLGLVEVILVVYLIARINKMSMGMAVASFIIYSALNGLTLSVILYSYTFNSIAVTFGVSALIFVVMAIYGYVTKANLLRLGNIFGMAIIGIVIGSIVNIFLNSSALYWVITYVGVAVFTGLIAYDVQMIKRLALQAGDNAQLRSKLAIVGALHVYLDFINIFLFLLRIFGDND